jgi:hypothetical protein
MPSAVSRTSARVASNTAPPPAVQRTTSSWSRACAATSSGKLRHTPSLPPPRCARRSAAECAVTAKPCDSSKLAQRVTSRSAGSGCASAAIALRPRLVKTMRKTASSVAPAPYQA